MALTRRQILLLMILRRKFRKKNQKFVQGRLWVRKIYQERKDKGEFHLLVQEMKLFDHQYFYQQFRMSPAKFEELLNIVAPRIAKCSVQREPIGPSERLCCTLRYLVTGDAQSTIAASYRISKTSVCRIVKETTDALWDVLKGNFLKVPQTEEEWINIANQFEAKWNFGNCIGAIDGKHVIMQAPARSGSCYFNYKKTHSIVLLAVVNSNYEFILVDIGDAGRQSDGGVFASSNLGYAMDQKLLNIPKPRPLKGTTKSFPFVFVGDEAFPLKDYLIKPYARICLHLREKVANYRISRARRLVENVFGICASRFRVLRRPIIAKVETVISITKAIIALHNYLMHGRQFGKHEDYCPAGYAEGDWRDNETETDGLAPLSSKAGSNNYSRDAKQIRDDFRDYFTSPEGSVPWQWDAVTRTSDPFDG